MKSIFERAWQAVGGDDPRVMGVVRDDGPETVDVLHVADRPQPGLTSYGTIGLYQGGTGNLAENNRPLRVELLAVARSGYADFMNMLGSCAFNVLSGDYGIRPDTIFPDIVGQYLPGVSTKHMLFVPVFSFPPPANLDVDGVVVTWLQAVPVTQREFAYARGNGAEALEDLLEEHDVDITDLDRSSVA